MRASKFNITIALLIHSVKPIAEISTVMEMDPTEIRTYGTGSGDFEKESLCNLWIFHKRYQQVTDIDELIQEFLVQVPNLSEKIQLLKRHSRCVLRLSIVSLYGQIGFSLSQEDLNLLHHMDIPTEISFFSYGKCIDK